MERGRNSRRWNSMLSSQPLSSSAMRAGLGFALVASVAVLPGCEASPIERQERNPSQATASGAPVTDSRKPANGATSGPAFLVNGLRDGLIPSAPQMGDLTVRGDCLIFVMRGSAATPLWPAGSTIEATTGGLRIAVPGREPISVPSKTSLPGAFVPLNSTNMTRFDGKLPSGCPAAIFAVAKS